MRFHPLLLTGADVAAPPAKRCCPRPVADEDRRRAQPGGAGGAAARSGRPAAGAVRPRAAGAAADRRARQGPDQAGDLHRHRRRVRRADRDPADRGGHRALGQPDPPGVLRDRRDRARHHLVPRLQPRRVCPRHAARDHRRGARVRVGPGRARLRRRRARRPARRRARRPDAGGRRGGNFARPRPGHRAARGTGRDRHDRGGGRPGSDGGGLRVGDLPGGTGRWPSPRCRPCWWPECSAPAGRPRRRRAQPDGNCILGIICLPSSSPTPAPSCAVGLFAGPDADDVVFTVRPRQPVSDALGR